MRTLGAMPSSWCLELAEAGGAAQQHVDHLERPAVADVMQHLVEGFGHARSLPDHVGRRILRATGVTTSC